ncbi:MAG: DEAD/DEAH box helicase family protein, partial [Lachnospiraceae bacterium]|nr:DEAD/DEAH box helicase family protein [Lachnospiraceae bacterium]
MLYADVIVNIFTDALDRPFSYLVPEEMEGEIVPGSKVMVPFGTNRTVDAFVTGLSDSCSYDPEKIKKILKVYTGEETVDARLIRLADWMRRTYGGVMAQALKTVLPTKKRIKRRAEASSVFNEVPVYSPALLSSGQKRTVEEIFAEWEREHPRPVLIRGVTGSGKTLIYMELIQKTLDEGKDVIVMVPEISLTRQTVL